MRYADKLEGSDEIIRRLFDPRYNYKNIPLSAKHRYLQHYLEEKWPEICGANLAKSCWPEKIEGSDLYIRTVNSLLANELYMMQSLFLQKVNSFLLGRTIIKKLYFRTGGAIRREQKELAKRKAAAIEAEKPVYVPCPVCGRNMEQGLTMCSVCGRQRREEERQKIAELLRVEPWLTYENCLKYYKCDKISFIGVKDNLQNFYFERVRQGYADKKECLMAVLFLTGREPQHIDEKLYNNALEYLRRDQSVSAFGSRLYSKK